ncbi:MAG TPA: glycosyltransferase family 4 protein [Tepidisphaeraceae bacterium]|nr:glycosyltransferase family 4 protein [Tepidisphaeraceae bacterium]
MSFFADDLFPALACNLGFMRRILLLITDLQIGGTPTVVRELAFRLTSAGAAHIEVACLAPWGPVADQISRGGINVTALSAKGTLGFPRVAWRLRRLIRAKRIDTVLSFLIHANAVAAAVSFLGGRFRFFQSIQTTQPSPRWHWIVQRIIWRAAERMIVPSASVAETARHWAHVPNERIVVIPNAIDVNDFNDVGPLAKIALPAGRSAIGFIGRLDPIKRIPDLLEALTAIDSSIDLHVFGDGAERPRIEQTIARLGLSDRVVLHGAVSDPTEALAQISLLVLPSQAEGFGLVLIEAMAAGVPVVATNVPGIRDVVRHEITGLLVPVASPEKLAAAIRLILHDSSLREKLISNARKDVQRRFSWSIVLPMYQDAIGLSD